MSARRRAIAAGVGLALIAGAAAVAALVMSRGGGDHAPPASTETPVPTEVATVTPGASPTQAACPSATPTPSVVAVNGRSVPLTRATVAADTPPRNIALVMTHGCWQCDSPDTTIERIWWDDSGAETKEVLFDAKKRGGSYLTRIATSTDGSRIVVGLCVQAYCGPLGEYQDAARVQIWESKDYGASWKLLGAIDGQAYPEGFVQGELVLSRFVRSGAGFDHDMLNWDTGERYVWPDWDTGSRPRPIVVETGIFWVYPNWKVIDKDFQPTRLEFPGRPDGVVTGLDDPLLGAFIWRSPELLKSENLALSGWRRDGTVAGALLLPSHTYWRMSWAGGYRFAGSMSWEGIGQLPTFVDIVTGEVWRVRAPFEALAKQNDRNVVLAAQVSTGGPFARVNTPGSCLNLRKEQSRTAEILTCIGHGTLLTVGGADNVTMIPVFFGPYFGWVAPEFVEFPAKAR